MPRDRGQEAPVTPAGWLTTFVRRLVLAVASIGLVTAVLDQPASGQAPAAGEPPLERFAACGTPEAYDHRILITKVGDLYRKDAGVSQMEAIGVTRWAICNASGDPLAIRFASLRCQNAPAFPCPANLEPSHPTEACGAQSQTSTGGEWIPPNEWGYIMGDANPARPECPDPFSETLDTYTFAVEVQLVSANGSPQGPVQSLDPELQIDRGDRLWDLLKRLWIWLIAMLGLGLLGGFILGRMRRTR
jgi:hypothetical protein